MYIDISFCLRLYLLFIYTVRKDSHSVDVDPGTNPQSIFNHLTSKVRSWRQQLKQGSPNFPPGNVNQLWLVDPVTSQFPGWCRDVISSLRDSGPQLDVPIAPKGCVLAPSQMLEPPQLTPPPLLTLPENLFQLLVFATSFRWWPSAHGHRWG